VPAGESMAGPVPRTETVLSRYAGWIAGTIVIVGVLGAGAVLWFMYHP